MDTQIIRTNNEMKLSKNQIFIDMQDFFIKYNWYLITNEMNLLVFKKKNTNYEYFTFNIEKSKISITVPLKNSNHTYVTSFQSYFDAIEYAKMHLLIYEGDEMRNEE
jgi:hypothetical protein